MVAFFLSGLSRYCKEKCMTSKKKHFWNQTNFESKRLKPQNTNDDKALYWRHYSAHAVSQLVLTGYCVLMQHLWGVIGSDTSLHMLLGLQNVEAKNFLGIRVV